MTVLLSDDDVRARLTAPQAVAWMGEAIDAHHRGDLIAPPRVHAELGDGRLVFTTGRRRGSWFGYRSYDTRPAGTGAGSQVVVIHDETTGAVRGIAVGSELGPRRVGAIGGVAADALAPPAARVAAIIGTGVQARTQLWALAAVRTLEEVRVYSRDAGRRERFAERARREAGLDCVAAPSTRDAVDGAEIVILATNSPVPVIEAGWLTPGAYVTTLATLVTDSIAQIDAYDPANVLVGTAHHHRLVSLGAVRAGEVEAGGGTTLFCSVGLAGTEAFLLDRLVG